MAQTTSRFVVKQDCTEDGRAAGWYVEVDGSPSAFYATRKQAERGAEQLAALSAAWGA